MAYVICPQCTHEVPTSSKFCGNCGQKLDALVQDVQDSSPEQLALSASLVGREAELRQLLESWRAARGGETWIEIWGAMGLGKTRLVKEAAMRMPGKRLLVVVAGSGIRHQLFGLARRFVHAVLGETTGHASPPETREEFASALALLGRNLTPFVDVLWGLAAPNRLSTPVLGPTPQLVRWSLQRGMATLVARLAEQAPDLTLFLDAYEHADEASVALFSSLRIDSAGWPLPTIVASRDEGQIRPEASIRLEPLTDTAAGELLDQLVGGAELPAVLRQDILARAAGVPLLLEETVRVLSHEGVLTPTERGSGWTYSPRTMSAGLPASHHAMLVVDRLEPDEQNLLCQCAVQGAEFYPDVTQAMQRLLDQPGLPVQSLLSQLERRGVVHRVGSGRWAQWSFSQPLIHEACDRLLSVSERRTLHGKTAEALGELAGEPGAVPAALLADHYEHAEDWLAAACANLRAGDQANEVFLNDAAIRYYNRAIIMVDQLETPSEEATRRAALAHAGTARVRLRGGAYGAAEEAAHKMQALAIQPVDRAEADRLAALAHFHLGRTDEAEQLLLNAVALSRDSASVTCAYALCDLAKLYCNLGRTSDAREQLHACRAIATAEDHRALVRADMLEADIADAEGQSADAAALGGRVYEAAQRAGSVFDLACASNALGIAALDRGDYETAQHHFEQALEIWELMGDAEWTAGAYSNLGLVAMSRGDFETAQEFHERALVALRALGNVDRSALAKANLAICAVEEGDFPGAVTAAESSLATLSRSGNAMLRGQILAVLGEGRLECGDIGGAQREFQTILQDYDEMSHPLAIAHAWRGLGRIALVQGSPDEALGWLERAHTGFSQLKWAQEAARTSLYRAVALWRLGDKHRASVELEQAREQFVALRMRAGRDTERADRLLRALAAATPST